MHDFDDAASALHSEQTLCSNRALSYGRFPYGLASSVDAYARGLQKVLAPHPLTSEFVGMASYAPTYFLDIMDDESGVMAPALATWRQATVGPGSTLRRTPWNGR